MALTFAQCAEIWRTASSAPSVLAAWDTEGFGVSETETSPADRPIRRMTAIAHTKSKAVPATGRGGL
jgi:hypothetical protein